jgi:hypothetical protein
VSPVGGQFGWLLAEPIEGKNETDNPQTANCGGRLKAELTTLDPKLARLIVERSMSVPR